MHMFCSLSYTVWYGKTSVLLRDEKLSSRFLKSTALLLFRASSVFGTVKKKIFVGNEEL